ncbi:MAG: hypothetical protein V7L01_03285 [Nostoc sp.]|uniref:hypothetical protein n=1 Tax=Nostoc sp. TaxID=1180 RepID=UPI002FF9A4F2
MQRKFYILKILTLILAISVWWMSGNLNITAMQAFAVSSQNIGRIISINNGTVERKQPGDIKWQKVGTNTILNFGDLLRATSNRGKKVAVKISCTNTLLPPWILSGENLAVGVANKCLPPGIDTSPQIPIDF